MVQISKIGRRAALLGGGAAVGVAVTKGFSASNPTLAGTRVVEPFGAGKTLSDASELNETPIFKHIKLRENLGEKLVAALRAELADASTNNRAVYVGACASLYRGTGNSTWWPHNTGF